LFGVDKVNQLGFYEHCVKGKACKFWFKVGQQRMKGTFDYVHANMWAWSTTLSHSVLDTFCEW